ncbi:MAG: hypothetical protein ACRDJJ_09675 [Actinomycetota bacterium]
MTPPRFEGAEAVVALILLEWAVGLVGGAAWSQSWSVVRRGHFRIVAWSALVLAALAAAAAYAASTSPAASQRTMVLLVCVGCALFVAAQYVRSDVVGTVVGYATVVAGLGAFWTIAELLDGWSQLPAALLIASGAVLLGAVTNGMLLGHWYLNQPGLKPWALQRTTTLGIGATAVSGIGGVAATDRLSSASTEGAALPGFGDSFGVFFYIVWLLLVVFTGIVVWAARRCVKIRSIQSATGLYYVALLSAGVAEFLVRYLMVNAS